jgi:hypothetical protein
VVHVSDHTIRLSQSLGGLLNTEVHPLSPQSNSASAALPEVFIGANLALLPSELWLENISAASSRSKKS